MSCSHQGHHSAVAGYDRAFGYLRFTLVCDECGARRRDIGYLQHRIDPRPFAHSLAERIGGQLGLEPRPVERLRLAALVRDIGYEKLSSGLLEKPGPLTAQEWTEVRRGPELSAALLSGSAFDDVREWILHHHERWDGTGYPAGLSGGEIPVGARVLAVVDAYEAMTRDRPHQAAVSEEEAAAELWRNIGTQFDVAVVAAFQRTVDPAGAPAGFALAQ